MDLGKRNVVIRKLYAIYEGEDTLPVVTLEEFFDGNDDEASIAVNLVPHPGMLRFKEVLFGLEKRDDVLDVFVEVHECPDPEESEDDDLWMTAMVVFVITSAPLDEVRQWFRELRPDLVHEGWNVREDVRTPLTEADLEEGTRPVRVWWD